MSVTVDANILIYASNEADEARKPARLLVEELAAGPTLVYLFWPTIMAYLRIATHPNILPAPLTAADAEHNIDALLSQPHVRAPGELDRFWESYGGADSRRPAGNDVPDAHVAALMLQHGVGTIYTRDRGFRRFDGIHVVDPFG